MSEHISPIDGRLWEKKETIRPSDQWASGFLEVGGAFYFDTQFKNGNPIVVPVISYTDNDLSRVYKLQQALGGTVNEGSSKWSIRNLEAVSLAERIRPFAPARQHQIDNFSLAADLSHLERVELAEQHSRSSRFIDVPVDEYYCLINDPNFLAGIYDSRGSLASTSDNEPVIYISTQNKSVLDAIKSEFGGSVIEDKKPPAKGIRKRPSTPSYRLGMTGSQIPNFLETVQSKLNLRESDLRKFKNGSIY